MSESIVPVITARIPNFIREQYPVFAQFVQDYFNWLEYNPDHDPEALPGATPNYLAVLNDWGRNLDAEGYNVNPADDNDAYLNAILNDAGWLLKRQLAVPKAMLLNSLRDFYLSRGSVQSFQYLFKLLFGDSSITISYPRDQMLVLSQANYGETNYIYIELDQSDITSAAIQNILANAASLGGTAVGSVSNLTAFVEDATLQHYTAGEVLRLQIAKPNGEFDSNDQITVLVGDGPTFSKFILNVVVPIVQTPGSLYQESEFVQLIGTGLYTGSMEIEHVSKGSVQSLTILDGGNGYSVGDIIRARPENNINGRGFSGYVMSVTPDGGISTVEVFDPGYGYDVLPTIYVVHQVPNPPPTPPNVSGWYLKPMWTGESTVSATAAQDPQSVFQKPIKSLPVAVNPFTDDPMYTTTLVGPVGAPISIDLQTDFAVPFWVWSGEYAKVTKLLLASIILPGPDLVQDGSIAIAYVSTAQHIAKIIGFTNTIGQLESVNIDQPYLILGAEIPSITVNIDSVHGTGATFTYGTQSRFSTKDWTNQAGFLGVNSTLTDSNKYQQFSYQIETQEDPDLYLDVVDDLLHPVGYLRFTVSSRQGVASLHAAASNASVATQPIISSIVSTSETPRDVDITSISEASDILADSFTKKLSNIVTESGDSITFH